MVIKLISMLLLIFSLNFTHQSWAKGIYGENISASQAWQKLLAGNRRFSSGKMLHPRLSKARRADLVKTQKPFAVVLSCSDSRVPPEILFDQGLGDLFVIRSAGNVIDDVAIGSIEYAVEHLGVKLILVLGHEKCGAVAATIKGEPLGGHLCVIANKIHGAFKQAKKSKGNLLDNTVKENIRRVMKELAGSEPILSDSIQKHGLKIIGARYDLDTGKIERVQP